MSLPKDRAGLVRQLAAASLTGTLGLFVGSGFSKALTKGKAPTWGQLLQRVAAEVGLPDPLAKPADIIGASFPRIASDMVTALEGTLASDARFKDVDAATRREEAVRRVKMEVSRQTTLTADPTVLGECRTLLTSLEVAWVITTNYDFLVEQSLQHSETLLPGQVFRNRRGCVPVFHVHGHVLHPDSVVLLEDDYVRALDHSDYRHLRLGILFAEGTTLMLGYALGDVNVQTALSYGRTYQTHSTEMRSDDVGQLAFLNRTGTPRPDPVMGAWGETIVDSTEIVDFLREILAARDTLAMRWQGVRGAVETLNSTSGGFGPAFVTKASLRKSFITAAKEIPALLSSELTVQLVQQSLGPEAQAAYAKGGWPRYKSWLDAVLDVVTLWPLGTMPPLLFEYIAKELQSLAEYIEPDGKQATGYAWEATQLWHSRKKEVFERSELLKALRTYAEREHAHTLAGLLRSS